MSETAAMGRAGGANHTPLGAFVRSDFGIALVVVLAWQVVLTAFGVLFEASFSTGAAHGEPLSALTHMIGFDANWYHGIVEYGSYHDSPGSPAFYPLFPLLVSIVKVLSLGTLGPFGAGIVVNTVAVWMAVVALVKIADFFVDRPHRWAPVVLFLAAPAAFFLHMFYTEAVFCSLAFWAYLAALRRQWLWVGVLLAFLTAVRLPAVLVVGLCGLEYLRSCRWQLRQALRPQLAWFALAPLGFLAFAVYLNAVTDDPLAMFHAYDRVPDWPYHDFNANVLATLADTWRATWRTLVEGPITEGAFVSTVLPFASILLLFAASVRAIVDRRPEQPLLPLGLTGLASIVFFTLNSNVVSVHRYVLPCLVIYLVLVVVVTEAGGGWAVLAGIAQVGVIVQTYLFILFVMVRYAG